MKTRKFVISLFLATALGSAAQAGAPPKFDEVYQLIRSNLDGVSQADLDHAALKGLLGQLQGQVMLVEGASNGAPSAPTADSLGKAVIYDGSCAYFRIISVEGHPADKLRAAYLELSGTNKLKISGIILDLRFASGTDYAAAAAVADCFLNTERPLLDWGTGAAGATKKTNAIAVPVAILVNSQTTGAAEALAAALREANVGLILGGTTAGQASIFKEFPLSNGERLRIATAQIKLGDETALARGLQPDISVEANLADEKAYLDDPYRLLHPSASSKNDSAANSGLSQSNQPVRRPTNEAELVRQRRAGETEDDSDDNPEIAAPPEPARPVILDAALARALDLLKGIAVLQQSHPG